MKETKKAIQVNSVQTVPSSLLRSSWVSMNDADQSNICVLKTNQLFQSSRGNGQLDIVFIFLNVW